MSSKPTYTTIPRPYDNFMVREGSDDVTGAGAMGSGGSDESSDNVPAKSITGASLTDLYINTWIKSTNYAPKAAGFYIDGKTGYIECMKLYAGSGGIIGGSLDIPDTTTTNSFHVDALGNTWWGSTAIGSAVAKILNTGVATFTNIIITGGTIAGVDVLNIGYISSPTADITPLGLAVDSTAGTYGITTATDGTVSAFLTLTWTAISSNTFNHYRVAYKKTTDTYYAYIDTATNYLLIPGLVPNTSYTFKVASVNKYGTESAYSSTITSTTATSTTQPATVAGVVATAGIQYIILTWTNNSETDLASYNIYRNTLDDSASSTNIGNCRGNYFVSGNLTGDLEYFYWIKAVNTSGLVSASYSEVVSATPRNVNSTDIADSAVTAAKTSIAAINPVDGEINANKVGTLQLDTNAVTEAKILDSAITAAKTNLLAIDPTTGSISASHIVAAMIQAGVITANKLNVLNFIMSEGTFSSDSPLVGQVSWANVKVMYNGTEYTITDDDCLSTDKHIYWQLASPTVFSASATLPVLGNDDFLVAFNNSGTPLYVWNSTVINGNRITTGSITATNLAANTITSNEIASHTITAENIYGETITADEIATNAITTDKVLSIGAEKILIDGAVYLTDWRHGDNLTKIDGGEIYTGSVTTSQLNFTPVQSTNVIASINSSAEGITITADHVDITGSTTFIASKLDKSGGSYESAASGARVLIFPDSNTGIQVIDNSGNDVFKTIIGGASVGDIYLGNYSAGQGLFYDKDAGLFNIKGKLTISSGSSGIANLTDAGALATLSVIGSAYISDLAASKLTTDTITGQKITLVTGGTGDTYIAAGKSDFTNAETGFILGVDDSDDDKPKFYIGDPSSYLNWSGTSLSIRGDITMTAGSVPQENVTGLADTIAGLQDQISGVIESWFYAYDPTLLNVPASDWTTDELKNDHLGDLFYNSDTGDAFRFALTGGVTYEWIAITDSTAVEALAAANAAQSTADSKIVTFFQDSIPTATDVGDLWIDTDDSNKLYRAAAIGANEITAGEWELARDSDIATALANAATAIADAATAQGTADGKVTTFYDDKVPVAEAVGDLWIDTGHDNKLYRAAIIGADEISSGEWQVVQDGEIATAIANAATAQTTADGKIVTFYQATCPIATDAGDLWVDSSDDNKLYRATAKDDDEVTPGEWVSVRDAGIAQALSDAADAIADAATAQGTADGKVTTFYQDDIPTAEAVGDLWIDTNDGNKLYRWGSGTWTEIRDTGIAAAIEAAEDAQSTADGKIVTFYQDGIPTSTSAGDLWVDTNDGNKLYRATSAGNTTIAVDGWVAVPDQNKLGGAGSAATGGSYTSVSSGAAVKIFPSSTIGLQVIDASSNNVFIAYVGGEGDPGAGDVIVGDYANSKGLKWDNSAATFYVKGSIMTGSGSVINGTYVDSLSVSKLDAGSITAKQIELGTWVAPTDSNDTFISSGKHDFDNTDSGFILGIDNSDDDKPKFYIGDSANYLNWNGTQLVMNMGDDDTYLNYDPTNGLRVTNSQILFKFTAGEDLAAGDAVQVGFDIEAFEKKATDDAYSIEANPNTTTGNDTTLTIRETGGNNMHAFFKFNLSDSLPATNLTSAKFYVKASGTYQSSNALTLMKCTSSWAEDTLTHNNQPTVGASFATYGPPWKENEWGYADIYEQVLKWIDGTDTNYGFRVDGVEGATWNVQFSSESSGNEPYLTLTYATDKIFKASARNDTNIGKFIGFVKETVNEGEDALVVVSNIFTTTGLTAGLPYYLSDTRGAISTSVGTKTKKVGIALSTTQLLILNS